MKVLVTGATGFVGQWLVDSLLRNGVEVRSIRRKSSAPAETQRPGLETVWGDITDEESVLKAADGVDSVFHVAGVVAYSRAQRHLMDAVNVDGTRYVVKACLQKNVRRLVHVSSVMAVGASFDGKEPLNEESPFNLSHLNLGYAETKRQGEVIVLEEARAGRLDAVVVNPGVIYGSGDALKGSRSVQIKVAQGRLPFFTNGGVSVIAIEDLVSSTLAAWKKGRSGERYILSGDNITIRELFRLIAEAAGVEPPKVRLPNLVARGLGAIGDQLEKVNLKGPLNSERAWTAILYHWFDNSKAKKELGLSPRPAALAIQNSVAWMKHNGLLSGNGQ